MSVLFNVLGLILKGTVIDFLPWGFISIIWLVVGIGIIRYRGAASKYWMMLDFPERGTVIDLHVDKINMYPLRLWKSQIEGLLHTRDKERYYRDRKGRSTLFSGGHEIRITKDGVNHTLDLRDVYLTQKLDEMGITSIEEADNRVFDIMLNFKEIGEDGKENENYVLTGTTEPALAIDVEHNMFHKRLFDELSKRYSVIFADGETYDLSKYNEFQRDLARSDDMASAIHYVKSSEAAKATHIKKKMGVKSSTILIIVIVVIAIAVVGILLLSGGDISGMLPKVTP